MHLVKIDRIEKIAALLKKPDYLASSARVVFFISMLFLPMYIFVADSFSSEEQAIENENTKGKVTFLGECDPYSEYTLKSGLQTGDVDKEKISSSCLVIERKEFAGKAATLGETLEKEAGIQVRSSGGTGSFSSISLRGSESSQVMVFMDGIPLSSASETGVDLSSIPLGDVEQVEVFKGFTPMNFGLASMGGAVNIKTLRSKPGTAAFVSAGAGSYGTKGITGYFNHKPGAWDYLLSFDSLESDNDYDIDNDNGTPLNPLDDREEKRTNAWIRQQSLLAKAGSDSVGPGRLDFQNQYFSKNQGVPSYASYNDAPNDAWLETMRNIFSASFTAKDVTPLLFSTRTRISHMLKREEYNDLNNSIGLGLQHSKYDTDAIEASFFCEWKNILNTVEFLAETRSENYKSKDLIADKTSQDAERKTFVTGIQDRLVLDDAGRLFIIPGIRYSFTKDEGCSGSEDGSSGFSSEDRYSFSPQSGILYNFNDSLTFKTNIAKYYRDPSFFELFGDRGFFKGNEKLVPEKGINIDAGVEAKKEHLHERIDEISAGVTFFHDRIYDLITKTYDARGVGTSVNVPGALITGVEVLGGLKFFGRTGLNVSAVFQNPENLSTGLKGKQLPGRFSRKFTAKASTGNDSWLTYAECVVEQDMYYDTPNLLQAEDRTTYNAGAEYMIGDFALCADIMNLTDERYSDYRLYPAPGRSFFLSLKYRFSDQVNSELNKKEK